MNLLITIVAVLAIALAGGALMFWRLRREYGEILTGLPTGLCVIDEQERVRRWNTQMSKLSGIPTQDAIGRRIVDLPAPWADALLSATADDDEHVIKKRVESDDSDNPRWVVMHSSAIQRRGQRRFILIEEITDYQRLQDELLHNERLASIGRLAAGVAHEIGNPVTGIACVAQNLADSSDAAELEQGTTEILKQTERITRTVGSLMQLSHPGSTAQTAECVPCNLADCLDEAIHLLMLDRDVPEGSFDNRCDRELLVSADAQLLLQVMLNLLDNARAASGDGSVTIVATEDAGTVTLTIDNSGPVIAAEVLTQVFEPFFTTKDVGEGTGLGLPLVRRMLDDMGGHISLVSPVPDGSEAGARARLTLRGADYQQVYGARP